MEDLIIKRIGINKWKLEDRRPTVRRHILQVLNNLPWEVGSKVNLESDKVIENVINSASEIEMKEFGERCSDYSENEIRHFKQKIKEKYGISFIIDFESIKDVLKIIDDSIGELYFK